MSRPLPPAFLAIAFSASMIAAATAYAESHVPCNTLPAAALQHAKLEGGDAAVRGCVKDRENGKLTYEVETLKDGKSKDITLDVSGTVLEIEQQVAVSSLPPVVSDAIAKAAHSRKLGKVESVTRQGAIASYETTITSNGERREVAFSPQGAPVEAD
jgi:hypothetical protein